MVIISVDLLQEHDACSTQVDLFHRLYGDSVIFTDKEAFVKACVKHSDEFDFSWARNLLTSYYIAEVYNEALATARKVYNEAIAAALKVYDEAIAAARKVYNEAIAAALKVYDEAIAAALKVYDEAIAAALKVYAEALATAWANAFWEQNNA